MKISAEVLYRKFCTKCPCQYLYDINMGEEKEGPILSMECCADLQNGVSKGVDILGYYTPQSDKFDSQYDMKEPPITCPYKLDIMMLEQDLD
jgi:hypothetical protein